MMLEWDNDSYSRKFKDTLTVLKTSKGLDVKYVNNIYLDDDKTLHLCYTENKSEKEIINPDLLYYRFASKLYATKEGNVCAISRRMKKSFKIGLCNDNYQITFFTKVASLSDIEIFKPVTVDVESALKTSGPISQHLFIDKTRVLFVDKEVGIRKGSKFLVNQCVYQEVKDSLRGFKCSIQV